MIIVDEDDVSFDAFVAVVCDESNLNNYKANPNNQIIFCLLYLII